MSLLKLGVAGAVVGLLGCTSIGPAIDEKSETHDPNISRTLMRGTLVPGYLATLVKDYLCEQSRWPSTVSDLESYAQRTNTRTNFFRAQGIEWSDIEWAEFESSSEEGLTIKLPREGCMSRVGPDVEENVVYIGVRKPECKTEGVSFYYVYEIICELDS